MKKKIKAFIENLKNKTRFSNSKTYSTELVAVLKDNGGGNHSTEILVGVVIAVVIGLMVLNAYTGFFSNTLWPLITGKITGMFK